MDNEQSKVWGTLNGERGIGNPGVTLGGKKRGGSNFKQSCQENLSEKMTAE